MRLSQVSALNVARLGLNDGVKLWISFKLFSKQTNPLLCKSLICVIKLIDCIFLFLPDNFRGFGVFHPDFDILVLPQDSPKLPGTRDTQCDCGRHLPKHDLLDFGQVTNLSSRGLYIYWTSVQHLVHFRVHHKVLCDSHNTRILQITAQLDRLCGHTQLLFRYAPSGTALNDSVCTYLNKGSKPLYHLCRTYHYFGLV